MSRKHKATAMVATPEPVAAGPGAQAHAGMIDTDAILKKAEALVKPVAEIAPALETVAPQPQPSVQPAAAISDQALAALKALAKLAISDPAIVEALGLDVSKLADYGVKPQPSSELIAKVISASYAAQGTQNDQYVQSINDHLAKAKTLVERLNALREGVISDLKGNAALPFDASKLVARKVTLTFGLTNNDSLTASIAFSKTAGRATTGKGSRTDMPSAGSIIIGRTKTRTVRVRVADSGLRKVNIVAITGNAVQYDPNQAYSLSGVMKILPEYSGKSVSDHQFKCKVCGGYRIEGICPHSNGSN